MDKEKVYLVQTDTTVGFSSSNDGKLSTIKQRPISQKILQTIDSFQTLNENTRVPRVFKKLVRNSKRTTFIYPNGNSFRVINKEDKFYPFISKFSALYSTSANLTGNRYDEVFAKEKADVIVYTKDGFAETISSSIYKLSKIKKKKVR